MGTGTQQPILGVLNDYAALQPEEGEDWESWLSRHLRNLARERIRAALATATSGGRGQ